MKQIEKDWNSFWAKVIGIKFYGKLENAEACARFQVEHVIDALKLTKKDKVLDIACGAGFHVLALVERGIKAVGIDISQTLISFANENAKRRGLHAKFLVMDMRKIGEKFDAEFDAAIILNQSFGFFDDEGNLSVLKGIHRSLKKGGRFYIQSLNPFFNGGWKNYIGWDEKDDGYLLVKAKYNPYTGRVEGNNLYITKEGEIIREKADAKIKTHSFRIYTLPEYLKLLGEANLKLRKVYGSQRRPLEEFTIDSPDMIIVGKKE